jgi:hypothetical protein
MEESRIRRRAWIVIATLRLTVAPLIAVEVSLKAETAPDPIFYAFGIPGTSRRLSRGVLLGVGGPHGEGILFGVLFGLPFDVFAYCLLTIQIIKRFFPDKVKAK